MLNFLLHRCGVEGICGESAQRKNNQKKSTQIALARPEYQPRIKLLVVHMKERIVCPSLHACHVREHNGLGLSVGLYSKLNNGSKLTAIATHRWHKQRFGDVRESCVTVSRPKIGQGKRNKL